jgi:hypothetical protein
MKGLIAGARAERVGEIDAAADRLQRLTRRTVPAAIAAEAVGGAGGAIRIGLAPFAGLDPATPFARRREELGGHAAQRAVLHRRRIGRTRPAAAGHRAHRAEAIQEVDLPPEIGRVAIDRGALAAIIAERAQFPPPVADADRADRPGKAEIGVGAADVHRGPGIADVAIDDRLAREIGAGAALFLLGGGRRGEQGGGKQGDGETAIHGALPRFSPPGARTA